MTVVARAAHSPGAPLRPHEYEPGPLGARQVDVRVTHCGVCHTDVGMIDDEFGIARFPVVAGHEAVGVVEAVGADVDDGALPVGTRVGVGAVAGSCFRCEHCVAGRQNLCPERDDTAMRGDRGAFADRVRAGDWRHVQPVPDALDSADAAPLLCAGATVFPPLLRYDARPGTRVAVLGVGGLGHLAVQFAAAWGCEVTAITSSPSKAEDARRFGATDVVAGSDPASLAAARERFDLVLCTVSADLAWDAVVATLRPRGVLCVLGVPPNPVAVTPTVLLPVERTVAGGVVGTPGEVAEMLRVAARHEVRPQVERFGVADIDDAVDRVRTGAVRYRAVVEF